jgi:hypothetical protein
MSGVVVIVIAALLGWCLVSVAVAVLVGRRLGRSDPGMAATRIPPVDVQDTRARDRRSAA